MKELKQRIGKEQTTLGLVGIKTKYSEDNYYGSHLSVWGSYFDVETKRWGYRCCCSLERFDEKCKGEFARSQVIKRKEQLKLEETKRQEEAAEKLKKE